MSMTDKERKAWDAAIDTNREQHQKALEPFKKEGFALGTPLELIIKDGAEWYDGRSPANCDPQGFYGSHDEILTDNPGQRVIGYLGEVQDHAIVIAPEWTPATQKPNYRMGHVKIFGRTIQSYRRIE